MGEGRAIFGSCDYPDSLFHKPSFGLRDYESAILNVQSPLSSNAAHCAAEHRGRGIEAGTCQICRGKVEQGCRFSELSEVNQVCLLLTFSSLYDSSLTRTRDKQETVAKGRWAMARSLQYDCSLSVIGQTPASTATPEEPRRSSRLASKGSAESAARTAALVDWSGSNASESSYGASHDKGRVEDETTISAALHAFAHGFCIFDFGAKGRWTLKRQPFHICDASRSGRRVCESRVDGFYRSESAVIKAIIEVKPFRRTDDTDIQISMQEGSQVASWISESPPPKRDTRRYGPYKRLLVSQDRDDIYFTLCTFSNEYVQYITGRMDNRQMAASRGRPEGFLKMQRQGPYNVQNYQKMEMAGKNILAFCMQGGLD